MRIRAPGKLMISGEWSVLELGVPCIVAAVNRYVYVNAEESDKTVVTSVDIGIKEKEFYLAGNQLKPKDALTPEEEKNLAFVCKALETVYNYLNSKGAAKLASLNISSELTSVKLSDGKEDKIGFGGSAAVTVATIASILALNGYNLKDDTTRQLIYKLGAISHYFARGQTGSGFDIAASVFGGLLFYTRFDSEGIVSQLNSNTTIPNIVNQRWKYFMVKRLPVPAGMRLIAGYTGQGALTPELIAKVNEIKKNNKAKYATYIQKINSITARLTSVILKNNPAEIIKLLNENHNALQEFSDFTNVGIMTPKLKLLAEIAQRNGAAGKLSGAGGGDSGIAIFFDPQIESKLSTEWKANSITPIDVTFDLNGVSEY